MKAWAAPLEEAPDAAFSERMLGDGIALDPLEGVARAPCDGEILAVAPTRHSVTIRSPIGADILIHIGIDTVALGGEGLEAAIQARDMVATGDVLLLFDMDRLAEQARSLVTPMLVVSEGYDVRTVAIDRLVEAGEVLLEIEAVGSFTAEIADDSATAQRTIVAPMANGIHARPAAKIAAQLKRFAALAELIARGMGEAGPPPVAARAAAESGTSAKAVVGRIAAVRAAPGRACGRSFRLSFADRVVPEQGIGADQEYAALRDACETLSRRLAPGDGRFHRRGASCPARRSRTRRGCAAGHDLWRERCAAAWRTATRKRAEMIAATGNRLLIERLADLHAGQGG